MQLLYFSTQLFFSCLNMSVGYMLRSGAARSKTMCFFNLNKHCQMTFLKKGNALFAHLYLEMLLITFLCIYWSFFFFFCWFCFFLGMFVFLLIDFQNSWRLKNLILGLCNVLEIFFPKQAIWILIFIYGILLSRSWNLHVSGFVTFCPFFDFRVFVSSPL